MGKYDDIINHERHRSAMRKQMSRHDRAAQFAPFAALTGYGDSVNEAVRWVDEKTELGDVQTELLNTRLSFLAECIADEPFVTVIYFKPDSKKDGGAYVAAEGHVKKIDEYEQQIVFTDNRTIPFSDIVNILCELFPNDWD